MRVLSVMDSFTREFIALEADTGFASRRVTRVLDAALKHRSRPQRIRCDNGLEFTLRHFLAWCIDLHPIQPGRPMQTGHVESFHELVRQPF